VQDPFWIGESHRVEPSLNRVTGPNGITRLEPKVMLVLACLADHAGRMVPKHRLLHAAWPDTAVGDDVLTRAISELRHLFEDDPKQPRVIETIPKSGYRLIAPVALVAAQSNPLIVAPPLAEPPGVAVPTDGAAPSPPRRRRRLIAIASCTIGFCILTIGGFWAWRPGRTSTPQAMQVVPLTTLGGSELGASFSPDGRQIAFGWNGEPPDGGVRPWWQGDWDIYIKLVGSADMRRLTSGPGLDLAPAWSPDGREIAYVRDRHIRVVSALGGSDRQVTDFQVVLPAVWSPDGRYLAAGAASEPAAASAGRSIYLVPVEGGVPRALTQPRPRAQHQSPAFSPDGHRLAFISCGEGGGWGCDLQVLDLDSTYAAAGTPRLLTGRLDMYQSGLAWTSDGRSIVFNAVDSVLQVNYLWRVAADGTRPPERIELAGANALFPSIAPAGDRLAFARLLHDEDIYRLEPGRQPRPVAQSSAFEGFPAYSPDGRRITFCSARSGDAMEVWVADADGSSPAQVTHVPGGYQGDPAWSPDGRLIAFQSWRPSEEHPHIWAVDSEGGTPRQITQGAGDQLDPTWSRDGEWIYFSWSRSDGRDIWRVRVRTGSTERVTHGGGFIARESADGRTLFYISKSMNSPLLAQPLAGGTPRVVVDCVAGTALSVNPQGIYYVPCADGPDPYADPDPPVRMLDAGTGATREAVRLERFDFQTLPSGFAVSPDGQTFLYSRLVRDEADLMLIEHFK
jgi:Tol biopolymer transport system component/DNA-binding winged helix-turn-helix (wHTH) protein